MSILPKVAIEAATQEYLRDYAATHAENSTSITRSHIRRFVHDVARQHPHLHTLTRYDLNQFLGQWEGLPQSLRASAVRGFLQWAAERYGLDLPMPDKTHLPRTPKAFKVQTDAEKLLRQAEVVAAGLQLPHQRAIFLCGFLYARPLAWVCKATLADLRLLPQRPDFYHFLTVTLAGGGAGQGAFFGPWLYGNVKMAERRWREWAGVQFRDVVKAGNAARWMQGLQPQCGSCSSNMWLLMPAITAETVKRLPTFWDRDGGGK